MNKNMKIFYTLGAVVLFLSFSLTGCDNIFEPPAAIAKTENGKGLVLLQFGPAGSRTTMPDTYVFTSFKVTLTPVGGGSPETITDKTKLGVPYELSVGEWSVAAVIYAPNTSDEIATGTADNVTVSSTTPATVTIKLTFSSPLSGTGTLNYDIRHTGSITPDEGEMSFLTLGGGTLSNITLDPSDTMTDSLNNAPAGYYLVTVTLKDTGGSQEAVKVEVVHIYPEQTTELVLSFADTDFHEIATSGPTSYTVTFNSSLPSWAPGGTPADPATITVTSPATTVGTLPADPIYADGWDKGMSFVGWYTAATGGTQFLATTPVAGNIPVYARWTFTAGTPTVVGDTLVVIAPETTPGIPSGSQGTFDGRANADGSVSYNYGAVRYIFPTTPSIADYDYVELDYISDGGLTDNLIFKVGASAEDYSSIEGLYPAPIVEGTGTWKFSIKTETGKTPGVALQIHTSALPENGTIKWTKATFSKGTRRTITFDSEPYTEWVPIADISVAEKLVIGPILPRPTRPDHIFGGWFDDSVMPPIKYTESSIMSEDDLTLTAHWVSDAITPITVDFSNASLTENTGDATVIGGGAGYTYTYALTGSNIDYGSGYASFKLDIGSATLADFKRVILTWQGLSGDINAKQLNLLLRTTATGYIDTATDYQIIEDTAGVTELNETEIILTIDGDLNLTKNATGELIFVFYIHAGNEDGGDATSYTIKDVVFTPFE